ncbi:MAG: DUF3089 domain-containing protein [Alphaproteobacteria bacterium]|nr:DUF3089 domain-containing protein [Alphaproteobacteria bacterium]
MSAGARNFLVALIALAGVVATIGLFVFAARDNLIRYTLNPSGSFAETPQPTPPDYATAYAWSVRDTSASRRADVFFIYPTVYYSGEHWNAPASNEAVRERLSTIVRPLYAQPFASNANLFMPVYRQAAPYTFMSSGESGRSARLVAYGDVKRAFEAYLEKAAPDRPFVIAGYGQGALYGMKLLADMEPAVKARLVAAFLLEVAIPTDAMGAMVKGIPLCDTPDQVGCAVVWHSTTQNARGDMARENALVWRPTGGFEATRGRELVCVNPLTWSISGRAGSTDMNLGAARLNDFGPKEVTITRALTSADCWNGLLFTDVEPEPIFYWSGPRYRDLFPSAVNPFYADIQDNVNQRITAFWAQRTAGAALGEPADAPAAEEAPLPDAAGDDDLPLPDTSDPVPAEDLPTAPQ